MTILAIQTGNTYKTYNTSKTIDNKLYKAQIPYTKYHEIAAISEEKRMEDGQGRKGRFF